MSKCRQDEESTTGVDETHKSSEIRESTSWDGPNDPENPRNFTNTRKWAITTAALLATVLIPMNGTSITAGTSQVASAFHISDDPFPNSYWTVTSWTLGGASFVTGMSLMEDIGVRHSFLVLYAVFILMIIPQALAKNYATLIVTRFLSGGCVSLLANTASSIIPDLWATERERSLPISIWILCYLLGNTLGPPVFAGIVQRTSDWRWIFYAQLIIYASLIPIFWGFIQETRDSVILRQRIKKSRRRGSLSSTKSKYEPSTFKRLSCAATRPFFLLFTEPVLAAITLWSSFAFGTVYLFTQSIEQVYGQYNWTSSFDISYIQISVAIGEVLGWLLSLYGMRLYFKSASRNTEILYHPIPEARLYLSALFTFVGISGGMFIYAWTTKVHWILPAVGLGMVGLGIQLVVTAAADYIEDAYAASNFAASAISACAAGENLVAGILPLATSSMYKHLGDSWASTLLAFLAITLGFVPIMIIWKGRWLRERSPFMLSKGQSFEPKS